MVGDLLEVSDLIHYLTQLPVGANTHVSPAANGVMALYIICLAARVVMILNILICLAAYVVMILHIYMSHSDIRYF